MFGLASAVSRANKWSSTPSGTQIVGLAAAGRNMYGPTLQAAYEQWKQSGRAAEVDAHKEAYLGYIQALL